MRAKKIFETVLYANDLDSTERFYKEFIGLELSHKSELFLAFRLEDSALLIFDSSKSSESGRSVPSHGAVGEGHIAFRSTDEEIEQWGKHFKSHGVEIEQIVHWDSGGRSLYVRDPGGNSVEFAPSTLWGGDWGF